MLKSLYLNVAELVFEVSSAETSDITYLENKYQEYLVKSPKKIAANILIKSHKSNQKDKIEKIGIEKKGKKFKFFMPPIESGFRLFNYYLRIVVNYALNDNNGLILHASSLLEKRQGWIFIGTNMAGKSTIRQLGEPRVSLGDDVALIKKSGDSYYLFGSLFYERTNMTYPNLKQKIRGICLLEQAENNKIMSLEQGNKIQALIDHSFRSFFGEDREERKKVFNTVVDLVQEVPMGNLFFKKEKVALELLTPFFNIERKKLTTNSTSTT